MDSTGRLEVALAVPLRGDHVLVALRPEGVHLAGHWEFPGGKVHSGEEPETAARRELQEETGLIAEELEPLVVFAHEYPGRPIRFHVFLARDPGGEPQKHRPGGWVWKSRGELRDLRMPAANARVLESLARREP